jgi:hypothetical protein
MDLPVLADNDEELLLPPMDALLVPARTEIPIVASGEIQLCSD